MKKLVSKALIVGFLSIMAVCSGCDACNASKIKLSAVSSMVKVPMLLNVPLETQDTVRISAAGGEYESFQVVVSSVDSAALKGIRWKISELRGKSGKIGISNITLNPVGYVETTVLPKVYKGSLGWWPDPLLRMDSLSIAAGERQPLWVTVFVPRGTPAGTYTGKIQIKSDKAGSATIPVSLRVWGFDIPVTPSIKTLTWVNSGYLKDFDYDSKESRKAYYELLLNHRLGPGGEVELDEEMLKFCIDRGMNAFILDNIPNLKRMDQDTFSDGYKDSLQARLTDYVNRFGPRGWLDGMAYIYNYDEVDKNHWPLAKEMYSFVKEVSKDFKVIQCLNIPEGVEALAGYADTWDVYVQQYEESGVKKRVEAGDEAWLAICCWPSTRPNIFHEYPAIDGRMLGWICFQTGVTGFEYWCPNHWKDNKTYPSLRGGWKSNTFLDYNGDGYLTYPSPDGSALSSQRLENMRDGFEDYEYLYLLKKLDDKTDIIQAVVTGPMSFSSDPTLLYKIRENIAERIEEVLKQNKQKR